MSQTTLQTKNMSLVIKEMPIMIMPSLAATIGLNEAIVLQTLIHGVEAPVMESLSESLPFFYESDITTALQSLSAQGLVVLTDSAIVINWAAIP